MPDFYFFVCVKWCRFTGVCNSEISQLLMVEEKEVPGENHRLTWTDSQNSNQGSGDPHKAHLRRDAESVSMLRPPGYRGRPLLASCYRYLLHIFLYSRCSRVVSFVCIFLT